MKGVEVLAMDEVEVYHVLKYKWCVLEKGIVEEVTQMEEGQEVGGEAFSLESLPVEEVVTPAGQR